MPLSYEIGYSTTSSGGNHEVKVIKVKFRWKGGGELFDNGGLFYFLNLDFHSFVFEDKTSCPLDEKFLG